jgi:hypothetical protein
MSVNLFSILPTEISDKLKFPSLFDFLTFILRALRNDAGDKQVSSAVSRLKYLWTVAQSVYRLGYMMEDRGSIPNRGNDGIVSRRVQTGSGSHPASYPMGPGALIPAVRGFVAWSWPLTSI